MVKKATADRPDTCFDAFVAAIMAIMVLELQARELPAFSALLPLWPTAISYGVSYLLIAALWKNHHRSMRCAEPPTPLHVQPGVRRR